MIYCNAFLLQKKSYLHFLNFLYLKTERYIQKNKKTKKKKNIQKKNLHYLQIFNDK